MKSDKEIIEEPDLFFSEDIREACSGKYCDYLLHIFITKGNVSFRLNDKQYQAQAGCGIILIEGKPLQELSVRAGTKAVVFLKSQFYNQANPLKITHNIKGLSFYYDNPIMQMSAEEMDLCLKDLDDIRNRLQQDGHLYHQETLKRAIENFTYDIFDIYTRCNQEQSSKGGQEALVTQRFIDLLKDHVMKERTVKFYADKLCVTPKYLSRVCCLSTGRSASYWISQFALTRMLELLTDSDKSLTEISHEVNFQSLSHFTRFIKSHTGLTPSEFRMKKRK